MRWAGFLIIGVTVMALATTGCTAQRQVPQSSRANTRAEFAYTRKGSGVVDVFNMATLRYSAKGLSYLKRRSGDYASHIGGRLGDCSNDKYYCLLGSLNVAIPRHFEGQTRWAFSEMICNSDNPLSKQIPVTISCSRRDWSVRFTYVPAKGITSYVRGSDPDGVFELVDPTGLFVRQ